ncbi:sodium-dependent transporter [Halomonas elongata]|uniref:Transporter n=1 Tax=Halomonas elongata (strain ATCC 33173 / DSM 2581 / NBRC 15536 / NCIMB 2198 / 1H9) TaxID=768066 RepID=E1V4V2_HALED|nr:sodium-dependent transporter [Halomonas elongata]RAW08496.1 sodium-dependent transporter [Halomonas elongata]WBF18240.1 sodium-dependent transporter [Halomonas elongata]WPU47091.1 sodium-dependent transporter [Halomonas elongata DSM 2581]WVI71766.1 sodium-dependent transporter [Halomonas elongata]CBV41001.2 NSS family transport protein [Halomonas elongata DSM 2581]
MSTNNIWTHKGTFLLAAVGSAVGLGNLWRFPYLAGENGGGAFLLIYAVTLFAVGVPILIAEILLGRSSRRSPIMGMRFLSRTHGTSRAWESIGWLGAASAFIILSFYSVIAGWALHYTWRMITGSLAGADAATIASGFDALLASPALLTLYHTLFIAASGLIVGLGIHRGIENGLRVLMPALLAILLVILAYSAMQGDMNAAARFLFTFQLSDLSVAGWLAAMGQSFFTLSLGMGAIMAYGAYMPGEASLSRTALAIVVIDTAVALIAGLAIFALVFGADLAPDEGPGLMFVTLPLAFAEMPGGSLVGGAFFILVLGAAISSAISMIEPVAAFLVERFDLNRAQAVAAMVITSWALGLLSVFSFNVWAEHSPFHELLGLSAFGLLELLTHIFMPLGGLMISLFAGWALTHGEVMKELRTSEGWFQTWRFLVRFVSPAAVAFVFLQAIPQLDGYLLPLIGAVVIVGVFAASRIFLAESHQNP